MEKAEERRIVYPFTAIVGQEKAKLALLIAAVNPLVGGVLLRGDKGTGKSTMVRALADVLPEIEIVADCPFNCNPRNPLEMCDYCYQRWKRGEELPVRKAKMRVVDLPLSVTIDRLVGTLDVEKALKEGVRALQPGLLAEANRNILYIDEVNLLDDYIADTLLDAAAMGWNIVEREGVSVKHPARFILVGSMNPEEGELRPQILDRFGLVVDVEAPLDPEVRAEIVKRVEEFYSDPIGFYKKYEAAQKELQEKIIKAREILPEVTISEDLLELLAKTVAEMGIRTCRAEIVTVRAAKAIAALDGRRKVTLEDLKKAMELALPHRLKSKPFEKPKTPPPPPPPPSRSDDGGERGGGGRGGESSTDRRGGREEVFGAVHVDAPLPEANRRREQLPELPRDRGSRDERRTVIGSYRGVPVSYTVPKRVEEVTDVDLVATIRAAALRSPGLLPVRITRSDYRVRVRKARVPRLNVIILDSSGSMAARRRISIAKGVAVKLVEESYVKRDSMALIICRGMDAVVAVPPTRRYEVVLNTIEAAPTGGRTPLASALYKLLLLARAAKMKNPETAVRGIVITDGKANVKLGIARSLREELEALLKALSSWKVELIVYYTPPSSSLRVAPSFIELFEEYGAKVYRV